MTEIYGLNSDDANQAVDASKSQPKRYEFAYLDGLRGLAALAVVVFHAFLFTGRIGESESELPVIKWIVGYGYLGVPVLIVLSGYVLMLPLVHQPRLTHPRGIADYLRRRARRILPPYYAALALSFALILAIPLLQSEAGTAWDTKIPVTTYGIVSHLLLIHNLSPDWISQINGPLWSVAVEWQIYFLLPFVLLPLWRRINPLVLVLAITFLLTGFSLAGLAQWMHPWLIGLFAAGMLAAQVTFSGSGRSKVRIAAPYVAIISTAALVFLSPWLMGREWLAEIVAGFGIAGLLGWLGSRTLEGRRPRSFAWLESRPMKFLGLISYSVYLMHSPLLALGNLLLLPMTLPTGMHFLVMITVVVPITLVICWLFFLIVEKHFQNTRQKHASSELAQR
jgi:peptidoglycan/LPS O-acetylase OafA/YrhL